MAEAVNEFARQRVAVTALPEALDILWRQVEEADRSLPLARTLTINFIGVADASGEDDLRASIERLLVRHACRAFLIVFDEHEVTLSATLAARTRIEGKCRQTVLEQIVLHTPAHELAKVPGLILPLLASDLPTHLYWSTPLPENLSQLSVLSRVADQTVINSARLEQPRADQERLRDAGMAPIDLVRFRLRPWRRAIAEAFEHFDFDPRTPTEVTIEHAACPAARAAADQLGTWLAERLHAKWSTTSSQPTGGAPPNDPCRVSLHHGKTHVEVRHLRERARLCVDVTRDDVCMLPFEVPASRGQEGDLLAAAVDLL